MAFRYSGEHQRFCRRVTDYQDGGTGIQLGYQNYLDYTTITGKNQNYVRQ